MDYCRANDHVPAVEPPRLGERNGSLFWAVRAKGLGFLIIREAANGLRWEVALVLKEEV